MTHKKIRFDNFGIVIHHWYSCKWPDFTQNLTFMTCLCLEYVQVKLYLINSQYWCDVCGCLMKLDAIIHL